jgi:hypothetical protein
MSNHYHLLLETPGGNLSQIMRHINGAYTTFFNNKHKRVGHLFQGRFKAILVEADAYAMELSRYIHLNPARAGIVAAPQQYLWSSYGGYIGQNQTFPWLETGFILRYFSGQKKEAEKKYRTFVEEMIGKQYDNPMKNATGGTILGTSGFVEKIIAGHLGKTGQAKDVPAVRQLLARPSPDQIIQIVEKAFEAEKKLARQAAMYLCHRYSGEKLLKIGQIFSVGPSAISEASRLFSKKIGTDKNLREKIEWIKLNLIT